MQQCMHFDGTSTVPLSYHPCTAEIHMKYKLRMSPDQVIENAVNAVKHLRSLGCSDIEFSPEDAGGCPAAPPPPPCPY